MAKVDEDATRIRPVSPLPEGGVDLDYCRGTVPYWAAFSRNEEPPSGHMIERMALACTHLQFRDAVVAALTKCAPPSLFEDDALEVVQPLMALDPDPWTLRLSALETAGAIPTQPECADLLSVMAQFVFFAGDPSVTRMVLDRAMKCQPEHRLSRLTEKMIDQAVNPKLVRASAQAIAEQEGAACL
jgi:hypothetical protein